ncbi:MAG: NUDIX domain-containing protein [Ruminococcus sp.]|nr:NUDIX domain-containing protein [Ruminococcus sp.]
MMIAKDKRGNELLEIIFADEDVVDNYKPLTHSLAVVKVGADYLMGYNHYRNDWEIFGGCIENNESIRDCIIREGYEEFGIKSNDYKFIGLIKYKMAPGYFNPEWHEEYGALYGLSLDKAALDIINEHQRDKDEVERIDFYSKIKSNEEIAIIDEKLLDYY